MLHKPRGMIAIMFGAPSRFAHDEPARDEDHLDREDQGGHQDQDGGDDERQEDSLTQLYRGLREGHQEAARDAMAIAQCLQKMVHAASREDDKALQHWYEQCCRLHRGQAAANGRCASIGATTSRCAVDVDRPTRERTNTVDY